MKFIFWFDVIIVVKHIQLNNAVINIWFWIQQNNYWFQIWLFVIIVNMFVKLIVEWKSKFTEITIILNRCCSYSFVIYINIIKVNVLNFDLFLIWLTSFFIILIFFYFFCHIFIVIIYILFLIFIFTVIILIHIFLHINFNSILIVIIIHKLRSLLIKWLICLI